MCIPTSLDDAYNTKGCIANNMHWPCGLGCQLWGLCRYAYVSTNLHHDCFALDGIISYPAPFLHSFGENNSQIPFCNRSANSQDLGHYPTTPVSPTPSSRTFPSFPKVAQTKIAWFYIWEASQTWDTSISAFKLLGTIARSSTDFCCP